MSAQLSHRERNMSNPAVPSHPFIRAATLSEETASTQHPEWQPKPKSMSWSQQDMKRELQKWMMTINYETELGFTENSEHEHAADGH
ncbi:hypothetical protein KEM55_009211 [Ascosphaera atra]|nr:hypothetical protein KEM55_009211 [Ascosphaera atra]